MVPSGGCAAHPGKREPALMRGWPARCHVVCEKNMKNFMKTRIYIIYIYVKVNKICKYNLSVFKYHIHCHIHFDGEAAYHHNFSHPSRLIPSLDDIQTLWIEDVPAIRAPAC